MRRTPPERSQGSVYPPDLQGSEENTRDYRRRLFSRQDVLRQLSARFKGDKSLSGIYGTQKSYTANELYHRPPTEPNYNHGARNAKGRLPPGVEEACQPHRAATVLQVHFNSTGAPIHPHRREEPLPTETNSVGTQYRNEKKRQATPDQGTSRKKPRIPEIPGRIPVCTPEVPIA